MVKIASHMEMSTIDSVIGQTYQDLVDPYHHSMSISVKLKYSQLCMCAEIL